jgi:hypothetical protein
VADGSFVSVRAQVVMIQRVVRLHQAKRAARNLRLERKREENLRKRELQRRAKESASIVQWMEYLDTSHGVFYYYNPLTQESRWERPPPEDGIVIPYVQVTGGISAAGSTTASTWDSRAAFVSAATAVTAFSSYGHSAAAATATPAAVYCVQCETETASGTCNECGDP